MDAALSTISLSIGYPATRSGASLVLLSDLNLSLPEASLTVLVGSNGIGKSTLLRTLAGTQRQLTGSVFIGADRFETLSVRQRARRLALVYTDRTGGGGLTVSELVALGRQPYTGFLGRLSDDDRRIVGEAISSVGIGHKADAYVARLSDGERQKVMIARALAQQTPIIILDEPTSFLDVASRLEIMQLLGDLARSQAKTILLSTHDIAPALSVADRLWIADPVNRTILQGPRDALIADGAMQLLFPDRNIEFDSRALDFRLSR